MLRNGLNISVLTSRLLLSIVLFLVIISCSKNDDGGGNNNNPPATVTAEVTIMANDNKQVIQGFGCATVFAPPDTSPLTSEEFDRLFGSNTGQVGLNILRIRVASDDAWRATELNHAKAAVQRGAIVIASPWSPPAKMKTNNNIIGGKLIPDSAAAYAKYLNDFAVYMANNGAPLYSISVQNEPDWEPTYEGCVWTASEMISFLKNHGGAITSTRLMAPEIVNNNQNYVNTILSDEGAVANLDILGTHIYGGGIIDNPVARSKNKEVWMTEHLETDITYNANINTAVEIHDCFTKANFNAYIWWYGKRFYGLIGQDGLVTKRGYIVSHFSRFIRQGYIRLGTTEATKGGLYISAYKNGNKKVVVAINIRNENVTQTIKVQDGALGDVIPYTTTTSSDVVQGTKITAANNAVSFLLPAYSITTFVEQ